MIISMSTFLFERFCVYMIMSKYIRLELKLGGLDWKNRLVSKRQKKKKSECSIWDINGIDSCQNF